ncbi:hypothetical protein GBAR_LOCUS17625, partial [Geodia barretti]
AGQGQHRAITRTRNLVCGLGRRNEASILPVPVVKPLRAQHMTTRGQSFALMFFLPKYKSARETNKCCCCVHKAHVEFFSSLCNLATSLSSIFPLTPYHMSTCSIIVFTTNTCIAI